jgi:hypothetical protein
MMRRSATSVHTMFVPRNYDEGLTADCGLRLLRCEDATLNIAKIAERRCSSRAERSKLLREIEGDETYNGQQEFLTVAARLAREGRLSRFVNLKLFWGSGIERT